MQQTASPRNQPGVSGQLLDAADRGEGAEPEAELVLEAVQNRTEHFHTL